MTKTFTFKYVVALLSSLVFGTAFGSSLVVNFSGMNPHNGQNLYLRILDKSGSKEIDRISVTVTPEFSITSDNLTTGSNYMVDFYADFNGNGKYDAPPVDHAWRLNLDTASDNDTLDFVHNTVFTDILWPYQLTVDFTGMTPHIGQLLELRVVDKLDGSEMGRIKLDEVTQADFSVTVPGLKNGRSYMVDFFADLNQNKLYNSPPADHAWRLDLDSVTGDTTLTFAHNTQFTDVKYPNILTVELSNMTPHIGQLLILRVIDKSDGTEMGRVKLDSVVQAFICVSIPGIVPGESYMIDFFADLNKNKKYDSPPADHAWRLNLDNAKGDTTVQFTHNTVFTDVKLPNLLKVEFKNMTPHLNQMMELRVTDKNSGKEAGRIKLDSVAQADFIITVPGILVDSNYNVDFYADHNGNKKYDVPPADHAWRIVLDNVAGDTTLTFIHNTSFTDIMWKYLLTIQFMSMTPHIGQLFDLKVYDVSDNTVSGTFHLDSVLQANFSAKLPVIMTGESYRIDFYADLNKNGTYDSPPADHAWRLELNNANTDTTLTFTHNTNFTDIYPPSTGVNSTVVKANFIISPNPSTGIISLRTTDGSVIEYHKLYDLTGKLVAGTIVNSDNVTIDYSNLRKGVYFIQVKNKNGVQTQKLILK